jgi:hypothetical protein
MGPAGKQADYTTVAAGGCVAFELPIFELAPRMRVLLPGKCGRCGKAISHRARVEFHTRGKASSNDES